MPNRRTGKPGSDKAICLWNREWPVLDKLQLGRRRYFLLEQLGTPPRERYLAFDPDAGQRGEPRAVLVLPKSVASRQQLRVLEQLSGSNGNVPRIFDCRTIGDRTMLVMDWILGPTLADYFEGVGAEEMVAPSPYEAVRLVRGLAHGLSQLHRRRQIIHGDIKPANLILAREPTRLVLIDFGSAWLAEATMQRDEGDGVSACYAAPELLRPGGFVDFRADIFSASVVLYQLLTLQLPYGGLGGKAGRPEFRERVGEPDRPSQVAAWGRTLPASACRHVDAVVLGGLALDAADRFESANAWLRALDAAYSELKQPSEAAVVPSLASHILAWLRGRRRPG